jgi:RsiW-degrading membrane proteinase PrsW (M82 family)
MLFKRRIEHLNDRKQERVLSSFVLAGVLSVALTFILLELYPDRFIEGLRYTESWFSDFMRAGLPEEFAKFLCFLFVVRAGKSIREPQDGVIYGAVVGMAFGAVENVLYIESYRTWFMAIRPVLTTGGHAIYGAIWGGLYSQAVYANTIGRDPGATRNSIVAIPLVGVLHATYNSLTVAWVGVIGVKAIGLLIAVGIYRSLVEQSPYRVYPLSQARRAIASLRRGLAFNARSPLLNRNMGLYLMHLRDYKHAAEYLGRSVPRSQNPRQAQFLKAACELTFIPRVRALPQLKRIWSRLRDAERSRFLAHLDRLVMDRDGIRHQIDSFIESAFATRQFYNTREKAQDIKRRRLDRKYVRAGQPVEREVASLSHEERERLARRLGKGKTR